MKITQAKIDKLIRSARNACQFSYSPYSKFKVGASVLGEDGDIYSATNVENASYGLTMCAERAAIYAAIASGEKHIAGLCIYTPTDKAVYPCGACLQVLSEFIKGEYKAFYNNLDDPFIVGVCDTDDRYEGFLDEMYMGKFTHKKFRM